MRFPRLLTLLALFFCSAPAMAEDESDPPYWASIRTSELNMRVGPSEDFRVSWVYQRQGLPLKVVRKKEGWRLVRDPDGAQGWVVARFLSRERSAIVQGKGATPMRERPEEGAALRWKLAPGVVGKLGDCENAWCEFEVAGHKGWVSQQRLWGAGKP
jgi:SH3-like domain-containing protein